MTDAVLESTPTTSVPDSGSTVSQTTPAPASSSPPVERPSDLSSLSKHLEKLDAAPPTPPTTAPKTDQAATVPGAVVPTSGAVPALPVPGPMPFAEHKKILENSRAELAAYKQQHGWAEKIPQATLQQFAGIANRMTADPVAFVTEFLGQLRNHPTYGPQLATALGSRAGTSPEAGDLTPDIEVRDAHGNVVGMTYSDKRMAERETRLLQQLRDEQSRTLQPILQERQQRQDKERQAQQEQELTQRADSRLARAAKILDVTPEDLNNPIWAHVHAAMQANPALEVEDAALDVRAAHLVPAQTAKAEAAVRDEMTRKAAANTANGRGAGTPTARPTNQKELAAWLQAQDRG